MAEEPDEVQIDGLSPDDLHLLRVHGVDIAALVRESVRVKAEQIRAEQRERSAARRRLIREVAASDRFGYATTEEIVEGIHADRRDAGWE